eukprot:1360137-Pyramimonas_sp.AAC.2
MAIELLEQVRVVRHDATGVEDAVLYGAQRRGLSTTIMRITVDVDIRLCPECFGILFSAEPVLHARTVGVQSAAGSVDHVAVDEFVESGLLRWIWNLRRHELIDLSRGSGLVVLSKNHQNVRMWQAPFLEFHHPCVRYHFAKNVLAGEVVKQTLQLGVEHARYQVGPVCSRFPVPQRSGRPLAATKAIASRYNWWSALGEPPKEAGSTTGVPASLGGAGAGVPCAFDVSGMVSFSRDASLSCRWSSRPRNESTRNLSWLLTTQFRR